MYFSVSQVQEFEHINGYYSMPELIRKPVDAAVKSAAAAAGVAPPPGPADAAAASGASSVSATPATSASPSPAPTPTPGAQDEKDKEKQVTIFLISKLLVFLANSCPSSFIDLSRSLCY